MSMSVAKHPIHSKQPYVNFGNLSGRFFEVSFLTNYPPNGEPYTEAVFKGFSRIDAVMMIGVNAGGKLVENDRANRKFRVLHFNYPGGAAAAAQEVPNASDQTGLVATVLVLGQPG